MDLERTQESLLLEAKTLYDNKNTIYYGEERARQIRGRLGAIALEIICRAMESQGHEPTESFAFLGVDYFGYKVDAPGLEISRAKVEFNS